VVGGAGGRHGGGAGRSDGRARGRLGRLAGRARGRARRAGGWARQCGPGEGPSPRVMNRSASSP
jgi:hypothetical protein